VRIIEGFRDKAILDSVDMLLHDNKAFPQVKKFQQELLEWNGPENAARFLYDTFGKPQ
jgi:hypothetical protein